MKFKNILIFLFSVLVCACQNNDNLFLLQNMQNDTLNLIIFENQIKNINSLFEADTSDLKKEAWRKKLTRNNNFADLLITKIDILSDKNMSEMPQKEWEIFKNDVIEYQQFILEHYPSEEDFHKQTSINYFFIKSNLTEFVNVEIEKMTEIESQALLSRIKLNIKMSQYLLNYYLASQIDDSSFKFSKITAYSSPVSLTIKLGESYESEIFLVASDSTKEYLLVISSDTLTQKNQIFEYQTTATKDTGLFRTKAAFLTKSTYSGGIIKSDFIFTYKIFSE